MRTALILAASLLIIPTVALSAAPRDHGRFNLEAGKSLIFYAARNDEERVRVTVCLSRHPATAVHFQNTKDGVAVDDYAVFSGQNCLTRSAHITDGFGFGLMSDGAPVSGRYTVRYLRCRECEKH